MGANQSHQVYGAQPQGSNEEKSKENGSDKEEMPIYPSPTGQEYDTIDKLQSELPSLIDEESQQQVDDYKEACDNGKGPMVACFATAEFLSMFERKHLEAYKLYENTCTRPFKDKSPNGKEVDGTKAYPPACFNLAKMLMTGKGGVPVDRKRAYDTFDRACRAGHGGESFFFS